MVETSAAKPFIITPQLTLLTQLDELRAVWHKEQTARSEGGLLALSGFEHQFLLTLLKIVRRWKGSSEVERQDLRTAQQVLTEAISDIAEAGVVVTFTQVKRTLSGKSLRDALDELWEVFNLASDYTPALREHLQFVISGKFEGTKKPKQVIQEWEPRSKDKQAQELSDFKARISYQIVVDPRAELKVELEQLARDEDVETTITRWLGLFLRIGTGFSPERISTLVWRELINDQGLKALWATLARLDSQSGKRLLAVRGTLGQGITLPRAELSQLQTSLLVHNFVLLIGPSGSGKSALCKLGIQQCFRDFDCFFLHASDIVSFTESSEAVLSRELRRLDELLTAQIIENPILFIDDLDDADEQSFNTVLNLLQRILIAGRQTDIRFVLIAHLDAEHRICEKISARLGEKLPVSVIKLPQLPIAELKASESLPRAIVDLIDRHHEFGPALNLKLLDWLVRDTQEDQVDVSSFRNDLDLLTWFWRDHVGNGQEFSDSGQTLIKIADELANRFTPDLPLYFDSSVDNETLRILVRRDCLRIVDERIAVTHRFIGDCARFRNLQRNRREIESEELVAKLRNPLWFQPIRWFALQLAITSEENGIWQDLLCEALEGNHLQLLDLLLDGAILSRQPGAALRDCSNEHLPLLIERLITRLLAIATVPYLFDSQDSQSIPLRTKLVIQEQITGIPKAHLWEPAWHWLLSQNPEAVIEESCIIFRAAEAWLNWSTFAEEFPLRVEVAEFTLGLAQRVLLPDPDPQSTWRTRYYLGDFESNVFACIVFALRIIPKYSTWFLRALAGREVVSANRLQPRQEITGTSSTDSLLKALCGTGILQPAHPKGPLGKVDDQFREFMLNRNGLFLNVVILTNPQLGIELFLALMIEPSQYRYEFRQESIVSHQNDGTAGFADIDVCTFKFLPLLSLLEINEEVAIDIVETLCEIATCRNHEIDKQLDQQRTESEGNPEVEELLSSLRTDTHELTLLIGNTRKQFQGGRKALYWHRNNLAPRILACLLMTLEGWLYSRPTRQKLEHSISLILKRTHTVAMLGVLVSLAKCDQSLISKPLLPLISSLQLLVWLESEQIDHGQDFGFDDTGAERNLLQEEYQELLEFNRLSYRKHDLQTVILRLWVNKTVPLIEQSRILKDWDEHQLKLIPAMSQNRALRVRALFERSNWQEDQDVEGDRIFRFVSTLPEDSEADAKSAQWHFINLQIVVTCKRIITGELSKTLELHEEFITLLKNAEQLDLLRKNLTLKDFFNAVWAMIAAILQPPINTLEELENELNDAANCLSNLPINLDYFSRCKPYDLNGEAFIAYAAPKLLKRLQSRDSFRATTFRCFIGIRDGSTCNFMRSWISEYGLEHPLTQELISIAPRIARLLALTHAFSEDPKIDEAWSTLERNFVEESLHQIPIPEAVEWTPEILTELDEQEPRSLRRGLDWNFLTAVLTPVIETESEDEGAQSLVTLLLEQAFLALLRVREEIYADHRPSGKSAEYSFAEISIHLDKSQSQFLDVVVKSSLKEIIVKVDALLYALNTSQLVDCVILSHVVTTLTYCFIEQSSLEVSGSIGNSFRDYVASAVGAYLFELRNQKQLDLRILGDIEDVWEKLIDLLSLNAWKSLIDLLSKTDPENLNIDQWLTQFFKRFQDELFLRWQIRRKLYQVGTLAICKKFRRLLFQRLTSLPDCRNDESKALVQVLAELWDSDRQWIANSESRLQGFRTLIGQLQEIDAVGARRLADQIADFLAHPG